MRRLVLVVIALVAIVIGSSVNVVMADTSSGSENAIKAPAVSTQNSANQPGSAIANSDGSRKVIATKTSKASRKSSARRNVKRTANRVNVQNVIRAMGKNLKLNRTQIRQLQRDRQLQTMVRRFQRELTRSSQFRKLTARERTTIRKNTARAYRQSAKSRTNRTGSAVKGKTPGAKRNAKCTSRDGGVAKSGKSTIAKRSRAHKRSIRNQRS